MVIVELPLSKKCIIKEVTFQKCIAILGPEKLPGPKNFHPDGHWTITLENAA